ncbi:hypothetical protein [Actinoallomurus acaciae]|uniref:Uncharacterized protein n=1 Tax=Actinoallomurus acaciae TaxID=502577 RepID=A0ABV5YL36_9ACTN
MDAELAALATSGATTLVTLAATESWNRAKGAVIDLYKRFYPAASVAVGAELEETSTDLAESKYKGDELSSEIIDHWQARFRRLLIVNPNAAAGIQSLLEEFGPMASGIDNGVVEMKAQASGHGRVYQLGKGTQYNL